MFQQFTTILILSAITLQGVFGGLQNSVSICLGGGHEHHAQEVAEHCEMECSHHSTWPTPIASDVDIDDCACTDLELSLVTLLATPRTSVDCTIVTWTFDNFTATLGILPLRLLREPPTNTNSTLGVKQQQLVVVRTTRLLL